MTVTRADLEEQLGHPIESTVEALLGERDTARDEVARLRAIEARLLPLARSDERPETGPEDVAIARAARYALNGPAT